ncbi:hypothetical protein Scep_021069 [Stephania cephalantha]|uniref:Uncharacterized protein n=1 Tax=Stephania cephalantha TaxID=152367 RepID=A0AAP0F5G6_9MAGN
MAVAAFLWTIFAAMDGGRKKGNNNNSSSPRHCMISVPVYVRGKVASLEEHTMGNAAATPLTKPMAPPIDLSAMPELVEAMRDVVRRVDEGGLVKRRDGGELVKMMEAYIEQTRHMIVKGNWGCMRHQVGSSHSMMLILGGGGLVGLES